MAKKLIRLTESDLHRIVKESVNRILNEMDEGKVVNNKPYFKSSWSDGEFQAGPGVTAAVPEDDPIEAEKARIHNERVPKNDPWKFKDSDPLAHRQKSIEYCKTHGCDPASVGNTVQSMVRNFPRGKRNIFTYDNWK